MLATFFISLQLHLSLLGLYLDIQVWSIYMFSESTKRNDYRYSEVVHILWLQDYCLFCLGNKYMYIHKLWY